MEDQPRRNDNRNTHGFLTTDDLQILNSYRIMCAATSSMMALIDRNYVYLAVNDAYERRVGKRREEVVGHTVRDIMGDKAFDIILKERIDQCLAGDTVRYRTWLDFRSEDYHFLDITYSPVRDDAGMVTSFVVEARDVSSAQISREILATTTDQIVDTFQETLSVIDVDGTFLFANRKAAENMCSGMPSELIGMNIRDLLPEEQSSRLLEQYRHTITTGEKSEQEVIITSRGERRWFHNILTPIIYGIENTQAVLSVSIDISKRKKAELALSENERRLSTLLDNLPGIAYRCQNNPNWTMEFISNGCLELTGYPASDLIGDNVLSYTSLIHPDDAEYVWERVQDAVAGHRQYNIRYRIITASGQEKYVWEKGTGIFSETGELQALEGFIADITDVVSAEERLRMIAEMLDLAPSAITIHDFGGNFLFANKKTFELHGYTESEFMALNLHEIDVPSSMELIEKRGELIREHGEAAFEVEHYRKDGSYFPLDVYVKLVNWAGKEVFLSIATDITQRREAEAALRYSEELLNETGKIGQLGGWEVDLKTDRVTWTDTTREIYGTPDDFQPTVTSAIEFYHEDDRHLVAEAVENARKRNEPYDLELRLITAAGDVRWVRIVGKPVFENDICIRLYGIVQDITERKQAESALKTSEEKFRLAFKTSPDAVNINKMDGTYVEINEGFTSLTGYTGEEVLGKTSAEINIWAIPEDRIKLIEGLKVQGKYSNLQTQFRFKDGTIKTGIMSASIIYINGEPHILSITRDISDRIELENQIRQSQRLESVGRLAGGIAHDFNNLITIISGNSELALMALNPEDTLYEELTEIKETAERAAQLTRQLLAFSRKQVISPKVLDLNRIITQQKKILGRLVGEDIKFITELGNNIWNIEIDPSQIDQILVNFAVNARDAIEGVGTITIETSNAVIDSGYSETHIEAPPGEYVMMAFSDSGRGMDPETRDKIFEPFFTSKTKGTGLGLSTVYGIVKQNNGVINVYSEPGRGTTFKVYFPRYRGKDSVFKPKKQDIPLNGTETIMVVEDESQILNLAKQILSSYGYRVICLQFAKGGDIDGRT